MSDAKKIRQKFYQYPFSSWQKNNGKMVIIPTGDLDALTISKHKKLLDQFYYIPMPEFDITSMMINKSNFYKFLAKRDIDFPKTIIPRNFNELVLLENEMPYPFIIKPFNSILFQQIFSKKCLIIHSEKEFIETTEKLKGNYQDVMIQEIIPGNDIYAVYMYFNRASNPLAICGYDKLRHYPPDFGNGSFCKTKWRSEPINIALELLTGIGYQGIAEPEFIKDPRDGKYKLIEINVRTTLQNRLTAGSGLDVEYIAYLDVTGQPMMDLPSPTNGIMWVDNFYDLLSCMVQYKNSRLDVKDMLKCLLKAKIHSVAALDDPVPVFMRLCGGLKALLNRKLINVLVN